MSVSIVRYLVLAFAAAILLLTFLAYLQPSFLLELGTRLQLC